MPAVHSPAMGMIMPPFLRVLMACLATAAFAAGAGAITGLTDLTCEDRRQPLGIDVPRPRLGWIVHTDRRNEGQSAYRILVASERALLDADQGDCWDSGRVASPDAVQVVYGGHPLVDGKAYHWKVQVWDRAGEVSAWSRPTTWEMGFLKADGPARWIADGRSNPSRDEDFYREDPAPLFRREFPVGKAVRRARLAIAGLGYYEATVNGVRVGDQVLDPGWTRYSGRVLTSTYDITPLLVPGGNCIGVTLGNGWYNPLPLRMWGHLNLREHLPVGRPRFLAHLEVEYADGTRQTVVSDTDWTVAEGPLRSNSIYLGEVHDARLELPGWDRFGFDAGTWRPAALATGSVGRLAAQSQPPIRVTGELKPVALSEPRPGVFIYDMGRNFGGWVRLELSVPAGTRIALRFGELLHQDGTLNPMTSVCGQIKGTRKTKAGTVENIGGPGSPAIAWQGDVYIANGKGRESWTPRFTFHAFRYVELTGHPGRPGLDAIIGLRLHADVERIGTFTCSDERLNRIQAMCDATFLSNLFSVQSDCPHRERFGYGGDIVATSEAFLMNYDMAAFYAKTVRDWDDSALPDGMLTDTAPSVGIQYCGPAWAMAHPLLQRQLHRYCGDRRLIEEQYGTAKRWLELVASRNPTHIIAKGLSDHEGLAPAPAPLMVTPLYAATAGMVGELAGILGKADEAAHFGQLSAAIKAAYLERFLDRATGRLGLGTQAAQLFPLYWDLLPADQRPAALRVLLDDLRGPRQGHLSTGIFGTKYLLDVLSREGHADLVFDLVRGPGFPGWGHMLDNDATTLWEHWQQNDNTFSHNHPMFGSVSQWFFQWLGGIQPAPDAVGFDRIVIRPQLPKGLDRVACQYRSVRGMIVSAWRREQGRVTLAVEIPAGTTALVHVPCDDAAGVAEGGVPAAQSPGVVFIGTDRGAAIYRIGSGRYSFTAMLGR